MEKTNGERTAKSSLRVRRRAAVCALILLTSAVVAAFLDSVSLNARLTDAAAARAARRISTAPRTIAQSSRLDSLRETDAFFPASEARVLDDVMSARDASLADAARRWLDDSSRHPGVNKREFIIQGLARWDVRAQIAAPFIETSREAEIFASSKRANLADDRARVARAAKNALDALGDFDKSSENGSDADDEGLGDALSFLREFEAQDDSIAVLEDAFLWTDSPKDDPVDSAAYFVASDFAPEESRAALALAARLCGASALLFATLTLGAVPALGIVGAAGVFLARLAFLLARIGRSARRLNERAIAGRSVLRAQFDPTPLLASIRLLI